MNYSLTSSGNMGKHYILILFVLFLFYKANCQTSSGTTTFLKEYHNFKTDTSIVIAVPLNGNFYCLKSDGEVFVINAKTSLIDASYADNSKGIGITNLFLTKDTIVGISKIRDYYLNGNKWLPLKNRFKVPAVFEDDNYIVTSTCSGEWGGSIYFRDKKTNKLYECQSTCTVNMIKEKNKYFVTATLAHMSGFSNIFEIDDPLKLMLYNRDFIQKKKDVAKKTKSVYIGYVGESESKSTKGTIQLVDTIGVQAVTSFVYKSEIFYLVTDRRKTHITTIQGNKFITLDTLSNDDIWSYYPINRVYGNRTIYSFRNNIVSGFIGIEGNKLTYYSFDWKHK